MVALFDEFKSTKNKEKRKTYHAIFEQKEKDRVKRKWKEKKMHELQKHIYIFLILLRTIMFQKIFQKTI